jgi:hypothetical protein
MAKLEAITRAVEDLAAKIKSSWIKKVDYVVRDGSGIVIENDSGVFSPDWKVELKATIKGKTASTSLLVFEQNGEIFFQLYLSGHKIPASELSERGKILVLAELILGYLHAILPKDFLVKNISWFREADSSAAELTANAYFGEGESSAAFFFKVSSENLDEVKCQVKIIPSFETPQVIVVKDCSLEDLEEVVRALALKAML